MGTVETLRGGKRRKGCPICGKPVEARFKPFCSERCSHVDLGRWLGGAYAIPGEPVDPTPDPDAQDES